MNDLRPIPWGRESEFEFFEKVEGDTNHRVLVFYGPGGQGKSEICCALYGRLKTESAAKKVQAYRLDFKAHPKDGPSALYHLRVAHKSSLSLRKSLFDVVFLYYQKSINPGIDLKERYPELFLEHAADPGNDFADILVEIVSAVALHIPLVSLIEKYSRRLLDHMGVERTRRLRDELRGLETWSIDTIRDRLPEFLARDLSSGDSERPVVLLDHYEHLWPSGLDSQSLIRGAADRWVRTFARYLTNGSCVIFSRERLDHWLDDSAVWRSGALVQRSLPDLPPEIADKVLEEGGVRDEEIRRRIVVLSQGHPLFLQVQIETFRAATRNGAKIVLKTFADDSRGIISRFVDHLDQRDALALQIISIFESIGPELFDFLADAIPSAFQGLSFEAVTKYSFFQQMGDNFVSMHSLMRQGLGQFLDRRTASKAHSLACHWYEQARIKAADASQVIQLLYRLGEHKAQIGEEAFLDWLVTVPEYQTKDCRALLERGLEVAEQLNSTEKTLELRWRLSFNLNNPPELSEIENHRFHLERNAETSAVRLALTDLRLAQKRIRRGEYTECFQHLEAARTRAHLFEPMWFAQYLCVLSGAETVDGAEVNLNDCMKKVWAAGPITNSLDLGNRMLLFVQTLNQLKVARKRQEYMAAVGSGIEHIGKIDEDAGGDWGLESQTLLELELHSEIGRRITPQEAKDFVRNLAGAGDFDDWVDVPGTSGEPGCSAARMLRSPVSMNIGLVQNARGKLCLVHDQPFSAITGPQPHVRYDCRGKKMYLCLAEGIVFPIEWEATEEVDALFKETDKIIFIRMFNKRPLEGFEASLIYCH